MTNKLQPIIDHWYQRRDEAALLRVVAIDARSGAIELQRFDGDVEEIDAEGWRGLDLEPVDAPEDWTGPFGEIEADDLGYHDTAIDPRGWSASLEAVRPAEERWEEAGLEEDLMAANADLFAV